VQIGAEKCCCSCKIRRRLSVYEVRAERESGQTADRAPHVWFGIVVVAGQRRTMI
jgi:hypothetical protein